MTSIFDDIKNEIELNTRKLSELLEQLKLNEQNNISQYINDLDHVFTETDELVKQLNIEARSSERSSRSLYESQVIDIKSEISSFRSKYDHIKEQKQKSSLIGDKSMYDRERMLTTSDK